MAVELYIPKMSDHMEEAIFLQWLVSEGEAVEEGQPLLAIETDKVDAEVESPAAGVIKSMRQGLEEGVKLPVGETIAYIAEDADEEVPTLEPFNAGPRETSTGSPVSPDHQPEASSRPPSLDERPEGQIAATPAARRVARELGIELANVQGTGPEGRILESDVRDHEVGS